MRKEARYGKSKSYRKRIKGPDGKYHDVYGRTIAERDLAVAELRASWAAEEKLAADPFVWQYAAGSRACPRRCASIIRGRLTQSFCRSSARFACRR